jgi:acetylornithine/N-succinyldiaminopimelate aminotransferase
MEALRARCTQTGTLLVLDEIQAGFGRTGTLWGFEQFGIVPDVLLLGKALGGGMPLGAFIASKELMDALTDAPVLGHITTFGGHPVCCAAGLAAFRALQDEKMIEGLAQKAARFRELLVHPQILSVSGFGLWMAVRFSSFEQCKAVIDRCIERGVLTDWFLFASDCLRISPPLTISDAEIEKAAAVILQSISEP